MLAKTSMLSQRSSLNTGRPKPLQATLARGSRDFRRRCLTRAVYGDPSDVVWNDLEQTKRDLAAAIAAEQYDKAAKLRDNSAELAAQLPPLRRFVFQQLEGLRTGTHAQRLAAIRNLGQTGDDSVVEEMLPLLRDNALQAAAQEAIWAIWSTCRTNPEVNDLLAEGLQHLELTSSLPKALYTFCQITEMKPSFPEGWNRRATALFLLGRYEESLECIDTTLHMCPSHWGALCGRGLCYSKMGQLSQALAAFEAVLDVHPGMPGICQYVEALRGKQSNVEPGSNFK